jgi:hypothetical protein
MTAQLEQMTDTSVEIPDDLMTLDHRGLVALASQLQIPNCSQMTNVKLREEITALNGQQSTEKADKAEESKKVVAKKIEALSTPEIVAAREAYEQAKQRVKDCITENQAAMAASKSDPSNQELKVAWAATRVAHKASIAHIKVVRPAYKKLVNDTLATLGG